MTERKVGLLGATSVGVGAIVGGGILVLAGVAFEAAGPAALLAFALNGVIALLTALSFAEMSTAFPESGGAYTFAKKVLNVRAAFAMGWVLWFAYIVAGVLYALGFAEYGILAVSQLLKLAGVDPPAWFAGRQATLTLAMVATGAYTALLVRKSERGTDWATMGKVVVFTVLVLAGAYALPTAPSGTIEEGALPFLSAGPLGLVTAMGFTFIALQGFDLIAAIGGEVRDPGRVIPRAMFISLGMALLIYLPMLFVIMTVGREPGLSIAEMASRQPETFVADAVENYMGRTGYWMVVVAAILSTLSALAANLLAASRVAHSMARDRTLPAFISEISEKRGTPAMAVYASALALGAILLMVPDVASAGAAASLIFLLSFALVHVTAFLARRRSGGTTPGFRTPLFPLVPLLGGGACAALAVFQAMAVPSAGQITAFWLALGVMLYYALFAARAQAVDAYSEAADPGITRLRGRNPLVLVPIAHPARAPAMARLAAALAPPKVGRVIFLSVLRRADTVEAAKGGRPLVLGDAIRAALAASFEAGQEPETLITVADEPWSEIVRVANLHKCESVLVGLSRMEDLAPTHGPADTNLERLLNVLDHDVVIVRAPEGFHPREATEILVPVGGKGGHDILRARLLGSLCRTAKRRVVFLRVLPSTTPPGELEARKRELQRFAEEETPPTVATAEILLSDDVVEAVAERASRSGLLILGLARYRGRRLLGKVAIRIASRTEIPTIMLSNENPSWADQLPPMRSILPRHNR